MYFPEFLFKKYKKNLKKLHKKYNRFHIQIWKWPLERLHVKFSFTALAKKQQNSWSTSCKWSSRRTRILSLHLRGACEAPLRQAPLRAATPYLPPHLPFHHLQEYLIVLLHICSLSKTSQKLRTNINRKIRKLPLSRTYLNIYFDPSMNSDMKQHSHTNRY